MTEIKNYNIRVDVGCGRVDLCAKTTMKRAWTTKKLLGLSKNKNSIVDDLWIDCQRGGRARGIRIHA